MKASELLNGYLLEKKRKNARYSITAFARDLGVSQSHLSKIFSGHRRLTPENAYQFGKHLKLSESALLALILATLQGEAEPDQDFSRSGP